jgi:DNA helicase-2/ATP-dependent DNA helicase PcrA
LTANQGALSLGQRVRHAKFGEGVVLNYEDQGARARAGELRGRRRVK